MVRSTGLDAPAPPIGRASSYLNSHIHFHVLVTDGVFSAGDDGEAVFHPALELERDDTL